MQLSLGICLGLVLGLLQIPEFEDAHKSSVVFAYDLHTSFYILYILSIMSRLLIISPTM